SHAAAGVNHDSDGYGNILVSEILDLLETPVIVNPKVLLFESGDEASFFVQNRYVEGNLVHIEGNGVGFGLFRWILRIQGPAQRDEQNETDGAQACHSLLHYWGNGIGNP